MALGRKTICLRSATSAFICGLLLAGALRASGQAAATPGDSLIFNGANNFVQAAIPAPLASNYTISAWVNLNTGGTFSGTRVGVLSAPACGSTMEFLIHSEVNGGPQFLELGRCGSINGVESTGQVPLGQWVNVAVTVDSNKLVNYFINGTNAGSWSAANLDVSIATNFNFADNTQRRFNGLMDEAQIWAVPLTQSQIQSNMNRSLTGNEPGLLLYYRFDEGSGSFTANSAIGSAASAGVLVGNPVWTNSGVPFVPGVQAGSATGITSTSATLNGTVFPNNLVTLPSFEWGTTTNPYPTTNMLTQAQPQGNPGIPESLPLLFLTPNTTYHFRLVAGNGAGTNATADQSFTTAPLLPSIVTEPAVNVQSDSASLSALFAADGVDNTVTFLFGLTTHYGNAITNLVGPLGNGSQITHAQATNLIPGALYHFQALVSNQYGTAAGGDLTFVAASSVVTTLASSGAGSLRSAINGSPAGGSIGFAVNGTIYLTGSELFISNSVSIFGPNNGALAIDGGGAVRVFEIASNSVVNLSGLTISGGAAASGGGGGIYSGGEGGGGILNNGVLALSNCMIANNSAQGGVDSFGSTAGGPGGDGGGIWSSGSLQLTGCTISGNVAGVGGPGLDGPSARGGDGGPGGAGGNGGSGGGIYCTANLTLSACTFYGNSAGSGGFGGIGGNGGNGFAGINTPGGQGGQGGTGGSGGSGGAIYCASNLSLTACTLSGNNAGQGGLGGAAGTNGLPLAGTNTMGPGGIGGSGGNAGGIYDGAIASAAFLRNTLLAANNAGGSGSGGSGYTNGAPGDTGSDPDLAGEFLSLGHNLIGDVQGGFIDLTGSDLFGFDASPINPLLGPLASNGGATPTLALLPGSPAIDAGDDSLTGTDQRGFPRKSGAHVDIGAFEVQQVNATNAPLLVRSKQLGAGTFQFSFADIPGASFSVLTTTNLHLPMSQWKVLAGVVEIAPGQYQFTDASATNGVSQYYRVRWP